MLLSQSSDAVLHRRLSVGLEAAVTAPAAVARVALTVHQDLETVADDWRGFEKEADCTAFQTFAWHAAWQKHIGGPCGVRPAVVVGRERDRVLVIMPLAIEPGRLARRLVWHGSDLCDYNAPLLAHDFSEQLDGTQFVALWAEVEQHLRADPHLRYDVVVLESMPEVVGVQPNPFRHLPLSRNPSSAYLMNIEGEWDQFYKHKRSSATRRHDRSKRKRLAAAGPVNFVTATEPCQIEKTLDTLFAQKAASFELRGVPNFLARPGYRAFFRDIAANPLSRCLVHVSRLEVGAVTAAANFGLIWRRRYYHVIASYDAGVLSRFGPGTAHLHELICYALQRGCTEFDFTVGDEPYKRDWCDRELKLYDLRAAATARGWIVAWVSAAANRLKRLVKHTPALWRTFRRGRLIMARLKGTKATDEPDRKVIDNPGGEA